MSTTVDQRVVEMQFNNKQFESGVSTTMSTLDKLKQKLNFSGASKGLEEVGASAKKVDMNGLGAGVDTVRAKFSALDVIGVTALSNITNSAVNAGKRMISALTIDPIKTGLNEYETQINAVQTILANTSSKGSTIDDVNKALEELNTYADKTIYNFTEMTRNIGTFTAAGVDLDTSVSAIQGIANLAAVSGSTSQQASTAMYQLSQALASGTVKLMDWNSVVNAGMGGEVFQNALKETARIHGVAIDEMIESEGSFRETLSKGWLTSEILTETLNNFTLAAKEGSKEWNEYKKSLMDKGYTEAQATEILKMANTATDAATKVKTFTQLWDVMKESAQSGWSQSWKILIGDFEEAKAVLTPLADTLTGFINKMSDWRNFILKNVFAFEAPWEGLTDKLGGLDKIKEVTKDLEYFQDVVNRVWRGDFNNQGDNPDRRDLLKEAGYDARVVQDLVNKGYQYKLTVEDIEESHKKFGLTMETTSETTEEVAKSVNTLTDEQLKNAGLTEQEIRLYRDLEAEAERTGRTIDEVAKEMSEMNGRTLLIDALKNAGNGLIGVFTAMKDAWSDVFPPISIVRLYNVVKSIKEFSESLKLVTKETDEFGNEYYKLNETGEKFKRIFQGVFSILDVITTLVGGGFKIAFKVAKAVLGYFNLDILDLLANIGDALTAFGDWFDSIIDIEGAVAKVIPWIQEAATSVHEWFTENEKLQKVFDTISGVISDASASFKEWIDSLKDTAISPEDVAKGIVNGFKKIPEYLSAIWGSLRGLFTFDDISFELDPESFFGKFVNGLKFGGQVIGELGKMLLEKINQVLSAHGFQEISLDMIQGLVNGIKDGAHKAWNALIELGKTIIDKIKSVLGIHSPSTVFFAIGGFIIAGLVAGLLAGSGDLKDTMQTLGDKIGEFFGDIDFQQIFSMVISAGLLKALLDVSGAVKSAGGVMDGIADLMDGVGDTMQEVSGVVRKFKGVLGSFSMSIKAKALKDIAIALAILAGAIVVLSFIDPKKMWNAVGAIAAIAAVMGVLFMVINKAAGAKKVENPKDFLESMGTMIKMGSMIMALAGSMLLIAVAMKILESIDSEKAVYAFGGLAAIVVAIAGVLVAYGKCVKGKAANNVAKLGPTLLLMSLSLLIMTKVIKQLGEMERDAIIQGGVAILAFAAVMVGMVAMTKLAGKKVDGVGGTILKMAGAFLLMAMVIKIMGTMEKDVLIQGGNAVLAFAAVMVGMVAMTKLVTSKDMTKLGGTLLAMSGAMLIMAMIVRILGSMEAGPLTKGITAVAALAALMAGLVAATKLVGEKDLKRVGITLLMMSMAIGVLAVVATLLGILSIEHLAKGIIAVGLLGGIMTAMIWATRGANECKGNIIAMTVAIAVMAIAIAALSFIDGGKLAGSVAAMAALMLVFTMMINVAGKAQGSLGTLIVMTVAIGLLGGLLYLLSTLPVESTLGSAAALSVLLLAVAGVVTLLSKMSLNAGNALVGIIALTAMAIPLLAFVGVLALMQNIQNATTNATALITLATTLTLLLVVLTIVGNFAIQAAIGVLALTAMATSMLAFVGILAIMENIQNASANAELLTDLMGKMTAMLVVLAIVGPLALVGVGAMAALTGLIVAVGALAVGVGALMEKFPDLEAFLDKGLPILTKIAYAIGEFAGSLISGFIDTVAGTLPVLGTSLSGFMVNAMPFITGIKMVDASMLEGVGVLTASILALTAASFINGITSLLTLGVGSLPVLGQQLSGFMAGAMPFITGASLIKEESVAGVKSLADMILTLTKANVIEGLTSWFTGGSSLENFGAQLVPFGQAMVAFSQTVSGIDESAVLAAANAGKMMSEMAATIPNSGGVVGFFAGENDMVTFASQLVSFGTAIKAFSQEVVGINEEAIIAAANAGKTMVALAETIPNTGGVVGFFTGENDLATFGTQLLSFGKSIAAFSKEVTGNISEEAVTAAANAGATMVKLAETLPNTGGVVAFFSGDNDLTTFGTQLVSFGTSITAFSKEVAGLDEEAVTAAANAGSMMASLANNLPKSGGFASIFTADDDMSTFGKELVKFGESMKDFSDEVTDLDSAAISSAIAQCKRVVSMAKDMSGVDFSSLSSFGDALGDLADAGVEDFIKAFEDAENDVIKAVNNMVEAAADGIDDYEDDFKKAAKKLADKTIDGIEAKEDAFKDACDDLADKGPKGIKTWDNKTAFKDAGKYLGDGLIEGINAKKQAVYDAAYALGRKAVRGEKDGQQSNSPSKATIKAGHWLGEGLIIGMKEMTKKVYRSGTDLGQAATGNLSTAIRDLSAAINTDIDAQPTIRPVMDLSEVRTGVNAIDGMFDKNALVGVNANVGVINTMMNRRNQNGTNDDIVSELVRLGKKLDNIEQPSYSIGNVTYDDGSNIRSAIETIVRYATIEGRS